VGGVPAVLGGVSVVATYINSSAHDLHMQKAESGLEQF